MDRTLKQLTEGILKSLEKRMNSVQHFDNSPLPDKGIVAEIIENVKALLFPGYFGQTDLSFDSMEFQVSFRAAKVFEQLKGQVHREAQHACKKPIPTCKNCMDYAAFVAENLLAAIPQIRDQLETDVKAAFENDPAASGFDEIIFSYPGLEAIAIYRVAHFLQHQGLVLIPRMMTEYAHSRTGVDIHPGAKIGDGFFIDHGTGVVIGETSVIGRGVTLYQGVTIGALNFPRDQKGNIIRGAKRHPTLEDHVVIYAGATILGGNTVIGEGAVIGGNVWLTESVPPHTRVILPRTDLRMTPRKREEAAISAEKSSRLEKTQSE